MSFDPQTEFAFTCSMNANEDYNIRHMTFGTRRKWVVSVTS